MILSEYTFENDFYGKTSPFELAANFGTPLYVYNESILRKRCRDLVNLSSLDSYKVNYSVKANSNPEILKIIREEGLLADAMSPGELYMDQLAGYHPSSILYIANNITREEMGNALDQGCLLSVDSLSQLEMAGSLKPGSKIMIRINPGIGAGHSERVITAGKNTKFGISPNSLPDVQKILQKHNLTLVGINQHIGSLFMQPGKYLDAMTVLLEFIEKLPKSMFSNLEYIDFGGGFGIPYHKQEHEERLNLQELGRGIHDLISGFAKKTGYKGKFLVEPGRYIVAECGVLLGEACAVKNNAEIRYVGTNIGFNVLMRPVLYGSHHDIEIYSPDTSSRTPEIQTIVGNICESGDILAKDRLLPAIHVGDLLGILDAGAYGFCMASNYNERCLPAEVLIQEDGKVRLIRRRQTVKDLAASLEI